MKIKQNGTLYVLIAVLLWSLVGLVVKSVDADPLWIIFIRSVSAGVFLSPYIFKEMIFPIKKVILAGFFMAILLLTVTITTLNSSSAMAISMQYTAPMYIIGYKFYKDKRIYKDKLVVLSLIFIGILLIVINSLQNANPISLVSGIAIGISFMFYSYSLQGITKGNPMGIVALVNLVTSFFCIIFLILRPTPPPTNLLDISMLCLTGIFISGVSYAFYGAGLRLISLDKAMIICLLEPILNPLWVYFGKGEIPSALTMWGVFFILFGAVANIIFAKIQSNKIKS